MINLKTYSGQKADFYIQNKGLHAGRPLTKPIRNCFAVDTDVPNAFKICYALYRSNSYRSSILGSVIPFIRKRDVLDLIKPALNKDHDVKKLNAICLIDQQIKIATEQIEKFKQLQKALAIKTIRS
tara:strand:+ start:6042 stop:6419 length:378 start_codon:yes stop_codon:yes gene_type:complete